METEKPIIGGIYEHFKGQKYIVRYIATHSENETTMVIYEALYGDHKIWARPLTMWNMNAFDDKGNVLQRFKLISQ